MYFTETMFNPEYINPLYFKQQQTQMTQYTFWQDQEVCKAAHAIKELCCAVKTWMWNIREWLFLPVF